MFVTMLEAHIPVEHAPAVQQMFAEATAQRPAALLHTYLAQGIADPTLRRSIGVWASAEAFEAFRQSVDVPPPMRIFRSFGATPTLTTFNVVG